MGAHEVNQRMIHLMDVRAFLQEELQAAYELLAFPGSERHWRYSGRDLASAIRQRDVPKVQRKRDEFLEQVAGLPGDYRFWEGTTTVALAWAILVESALLNERLARDIKEASSAKNGRIPILENPHFYLPDPGVMEREVFNEYVKCRWPIHVFALDPVTQDQNVADAFARRRELQIAMALAFASGEINAQGLMRFTRRLEWDMATIGLNRTVVGFSHGDDTFGWRFTPRFQTPPIKGNLATFRETLLGGPTRDEDIRQRELEPGMRECVAIVIMPSFVPYVQFDTRTNWFCLTHPKHTDASMHETMQMSRSIKSMEQLAAQAVDVCDLYRDGEVDRLLRRVRQLDRELPLQTMVAQVPHENTLGGFEMFNRGITDLAPELIGWYGAPGISRDGMTRMFLVGDGFSVHDTAVVAGGEYVQFRLLSRQVMEVHIPPNVRPFFHPQKGDLVDVHLATPYGVSSHLTIPVAPGSSPSSATKRRLEWDPARYNVQYAHDEKNNTFSTVSISLPGRQLSIRAPSAVIPPKEVTLEVAMRYSDGTKDVDILLDILPTEKVPYDEVRRRYVLAGTQLNTFLGAVNTKVAEFLPYRPESGGKQPTSFQVKLYGRLAGTTHVSLETANHITVDASIVAAQEPAPDGG